MRTAKHPDFLDLCIALTGRAPLAGAYLSANRKARQITDVDLPTGVDDGFWTQIGYLAGKQSRERIPLLRGLARSLLVFDLGAGLSITRPGPDH